MTRGYLIFECSPVIPIIDKDNETQNEDYEIASTHGYEYDDEITENLEGGKSIKKETYDQEEQDEYPSDR